MRKLLSRSVIHLASIIVPAPVVQGVEGNTSDKEEVSPEEVFKRGLPGATDRKRNV